MRVTFHSIAILALSSLSACMMPVITNAASDNKAEDLEGREGRKLGDDVDFIVGDFDAAGYSTACQDVTNPAEKTPRADGGNDADKLTGRRALPVDRSSSLLPGLSTAVVCLKRNAGGDGYGRVGGAFQLANGNFMCFATENGRAKDKGFWKNDTLEDLDAVYDLFKEKDYTDCKRLDVNGGNPDQAKRKMDYISTLDWRNSYQDVYDVLHDEGSGFGITADRGKKNNECYIGWVQQVVVGATYWFDEAISATETVKFDTILPGLSTAVVCSKRNGVRGLGHVGGAFQLANGNFMCFATENGLAKDKGFWKNDTLEDLKAVYALFKFKNYTDCKRLDVNGGNPDQAMRKMDYISTLGYNVVWRNCENDVYDVLHDEGSGFGITANKGKKNNECYIGWVQQVGVGPNYWFDEAISATETKKLTDQCWGWNSDCTDKRKPKCRGKVCQTWPRKIDQRCWGWDSDCDGTLGCCPSILFGKQCKKKKKNWMGFWVCP